MKDYNYHQSPIKVYGVPYFEENGIMERLPRRVREQVPSLENLGRRTPGARLAFRTDSQRFEIRIRFESISPDVGMSLFACQGANVYVGEHTGSARCLGLVVPAGYSSTLAVGRFEKENVMQDVTVYLPRNEVICDMTVSIEDGARLEAPTPYRYEKPVVFYGSSITEGGHASRPANFYNALLSRWLDFDYINLGFSGSARGELAIADYVNELDKSLFVYDYDHNAPDKEHLLATHEPFFRRIREHSPDLPVLMLTRPDADTGFEVAQRRDIIRATYEHAVAAGDKNVWYIDGGTYYGMQDRDACSSDGCHPNDLGMYRMAQVIRPVMEEMLSRL